MSRSKIVKKIVDSMKSNPDDWYLGSSAISNNKLGIRILSSYGPMKYSIMAPEELSLNVLQKIKINNQVESIKKARLLKKLSTDGKR